MAMVEDCFFSSWLATIPNYGKMPLYATKFKMLISIGSYVVIGTTVACIVDHVGDRIILNLFEECDNSMTLSNECSKAYGMKEIVQTCKKKVTTINEVHDLAFVFT